MRTAIYARYSSQLQNARSIEDQVRVCQERAEREGWTITAVFTDFAISGAVRDRPGLNGLVEHIKAGKADQVLTEALDRLSRHQGDMSWLHDHIIHAGARIFSLSEGEINELQIGFKGTMAALFRKDMADKIRRGQSGRVAAGRIPGNLAYGYRKVHRMDARGEPELGLREIDRDQAEIIRRIVGEYLEGDSARTIARRLNAEGVPSPTGRKWSVSMINGDTRRQNGILRNEIYGGTLVYNRTHMVRDPDTRRRVSRPNPPEKWQRTPVPELQIIPTEQWERLQLALGARAQVAKEVNRRPKRLLSGMIRCGVCKGSVVIVANGHWGCANTRSTGTCTNRRQISNAVLERKVLVGLEEHLLHPDEIAAAVKHYHRRRSELQKRDRQAESAQRKKVDQLTAKIDRLVTVIADDGGKIPELLAALHAARAEREQLLAQIGERKAENTIILHPAIVDSYREAVKNITATLAHDAAAERTGRNILRSLIDYVVLTPAPGRTGLEVEMVGRLQNIMALAEGMPPKGGDYTLTVVAEEGLEPPTYGL